MDRMLRFPWLAVAGLLCAAGCNQSPSDSGAAVAPGPAAASPLLAPQQETPNRAPGDAPPGTTYAIAVEGRQFVELTGSSGLPDLHRDFTVEAWVRLPEGTQGTLRLAGNEDHPPLDGAPPGTAGASGWALRANLATSIEDYGIKSSFELELALATSQNAWFSVKGAPAPSNEQWRHVAASRLGDEARLYVDGKLVGRKTIDVDLAPSAKPVSLGIARGTPHTYGRTVEFAAFRISSVARYRREYNRPAVLEADAATLALMDFRTGEAKDLSGHGYDGVFYGPTWIALEPYNQPALDGEPLPEASPPPGVDLGKAFVALRRNEHEDFRRMLRQLRGTLPNIEAAAAGEPIRWTTVTLNENGSHLGALRFTSPLEEPADMRWCFVFPANIIQQWSIVGLESETDEATGAIGHFAPEYFVDFENLDEPEANCAVFQRIDGGKIEPYREYMLWFAIAIDQPVAMSVAMRMLPASDRGEEPATSAAIARELGLATPLHYKQPETAAGFAARASTTGLHDPGIGVSWVEKGLQQWPTDRGLMRAAVSLYERRAFQLVRAGEFSLAAPYFQKAAEYAQTFEDRFPDLTGEERQLIAGAFYNLACSQALDGETDHALASLRSSLRVGFADLKHLETDPDLASLRTGPEWAKLVENLRRLLHPPDTLDYELQAHPDDAVEFGGHWYKFYATSAPWHLAQFRCEQEGGYLACVESAEEAAFVQEQWPEGQLWLGGMRKGSGDWRWVNGQPFTATRWAPGEPKIGNQPRIVAGELMIGSEQDVRLSLGPDGQWFAAPIAEKSIRGYLCEWER